MAGIYIKNMSMPRGDQLIVVTSDGVALLIDKELTTLEKGKAIQEIFPIMYYPQVPGITSTVISIDKEEEGEI